MPYTNEPSLIQAEENVGDMKFLPKIGDVVHVDVKKIGAIVANSTAIDINPRSEQQPRKRMRSLETVDMKTLFHSHGFFKECFYPNVMIPMGKSINW